MHVGKPGIPAYQVQDINKPYTPQRYMDLMDEAAREKPDVLLIDSISHAWAGEGGVLEMVDRAKTGGNNFVAWRTLTPIHNKFVDHILELPCHVIVTMRTRTEWITEKNDQGKVAPRKIGLAPIQRDGMEYEFDLVLDIDRERHMATASKDRTSLFDEIPFFLSKEHGVMLRKYLNSGEDAAPIQPAPPVAPPVESDLTPAMRNRLNALAQEAGFENLVTALEALEFPLKTKEDGAALAELLKQRKAS
mgnify:CR=1 FL=1